MKEKDLDKFLKGKLEEQSFDYNPNDWENALKLIEKQDTKRRPLWIWWVAAALALMLAVGYICSIYSNNNTLEPEILTQIEVPNNQQDEIKSDNTEFTHKEIKSSELDINDVQIEGALVSRVEQSTANGSDIVTVQKEVIPKITSQQTGSINLPDPISGNHPKLKPISSPVSESVADVRTGEDFSPFIPDHQEDKESVSEILPLDKAYDSQSILLLASLDRIGDNLYEPVQYSWETPKQPSRLEPINDLVVKLGFGYGISAYVNPYVANLDGQSKSITGFSGGLSTMYRLSRGLSINTDLLYTYRTGTFDKSNVSETKRYSFEALDGISTLNPTALHYASIPVYAGIHFGRHRVTVGGSLNYLGGVRGDVIDQTISTGGTIVDENIQSGWIAKDGFTNMNIGGMIGYDYFINNRWNISFRSNYLLKSIVDQSVSEKINSFIVKENSQVNLQIGSTYYFK